MKPEPKISKENFREAFPILYEEVKKEGFEKGKAEAKVSEPGPSPEGAAAMAEIKRLQALGPDGLEDHRLKEIFKGSPELRSEFRTFDAFRGYFKNRDTTQIIGGKMVG